MIRHYLEARAEASLDGVASVVVVRTSAIVSRAVPVRRLLPLRPDLEDPCHPNCECSSSDWDLSRTNLMPKLVVNPAAAL